MINPSQGIIISLKYTLSFWIIFNEKVSYGWLVIDSFY